MQQGPPFLSLKCGGEIDFIRANEGRYPSGQRGLTVNQLAYAFGGSNPPLPIFGEVGEADIHRAHVAQAVEHILGKNAVPGSSPGVGSISERRR